MIKNLLLIIVPLLFILCILGETTPVSKKFNRKQIHVHGRPWHGMKPLLNLAEEDYENKGVATAGFFVNKVDHFDSSNKATFKQRYWYNKQWYKQGGPIFLMLGGESAENPAWVERGDFEWTTLAKEHGAMVFLIEHRYYGNSRPTSDMETKNMKFLSSRQAIEDAAAFIKGMNERFDYGNTTKWVVFGGSYSGALAGWARQVHPELIYAAVGSSGPVQAVVDFYKYLDVVDHSLGFYSTQCASDVKEGLEQVRELIKTSSGQEEVKTLFNLCSSWSDLSVDDIKYFWLSVIGNYMGVVQYNYDNVGDYRGDMTIDHICSYHLDKTTTPLQHIGNVFQWFAQQYGGFCTDVNYDEYIQFLRQTSFGSGAADDRSWTYQTCTEFGYYQSTDNDAASYWGDVMGVDWYVKQCVDIFGSPITNQTVYSSITATNNYYGGATGFKGTRVILPNGNIDPWHALGVLSQTNSQNYPIIINGTAHCADMYPSSSSDYASLTDARQKIRKQMATILS
uniref:Serine protease K12H4.7 n=1 Tax=Parastrongyloides trichosuri TaxID=131310 RepID=A0A0N4Z9D0_PARTI